MDTKALKYLADALLAGDCCDRAKPIKITNSDLKALGLSPIPAVWESAVGKILVTGWKSRCVYIYEKLIGPFPSTDVSTSCKTLGNALRALAEQQNP